MNVNLNLETPAFLKYKISSKCHDQSEAQKLRWKIKTVHCSVFNPVSSWLPKGTLTNVTTLVWNFKLTDSNLELSVCYGGDVSGLNLENIPIKLNL